MRSKIRQRLESWLGIQALRSRIAELEAENEALRTGKAVVTADGKVAKATPLPRVPVRPRSHTFNQYARRKEAEAWKALVDEAYPGANVTAKR